MAVALNVMGQAEADNRLQLQNTTAHIDLLTRATIEGHKATADGKITRDEYIKALELLETGMATTWERALLLAILDSLTVIAAHAGAQRAQTLLSKVTRGSRRAEPFRSRLAVRGSHIPLGRSRTVPSAENISVN